MNLALVLYLMSVGGLIVYVIARTFGPTDTSDLQWLNDNQVSAIFNPAINQWWLTTTDKRFLASSTSLSVAVFIARNLSTDPLFEIRSAGL